MKLTASSSSGFTLVEVALALGVFAILALALLGLVGGGVQSARGIQQDYQTTLLLENLRAQYLVEADFPPMAETGRGTLFLDESGKPVPEEEGRWAARFERVQPPHWSGDFLEAVWVEILQPDGSALGSFLLQRAGGGGGSRGLVP